MNNKIFYERIYKSAVAKDYDDVRQVLNMRLFTYRQAMLYAENIKQDTEAAAYIVKQAICKCRNIVTQWHYRKTPTCSNCTFHKWKK